MPAAPSAEHADRVWHLFNDAAELDPYERSAFLDQHCPDDTLRRQVEALLQADQHADDAFHRLDHPLDTPAPLLSGRTLSHYRIEEPLGGGGMGVVYRARDTKLERSVALKFLPPHLSYDLAARERFVQEAKAASSLDHANICTIYEIGETDEGQTFIAMACYEGETLKDKIERGALPLEEALAYAVQMAEGLARAHEAGIVHRDVKPANVMVTERGRVKILDFGLAKMQDVSLTQTGSTLGTVAYMSPEQAQGASVDAQTDVWSLGVVLYELLTGTRPFPGHHEHAVIYAILHTDPEPIQALRASIPPALNAIVMQALCKDQASRYRHGGEMLAALQQIHRPSAADTATQPSTRRRESSRPRSLVAGSLVLTVAGLLTVFFLFFDKPAPAPPSQPSRMMLAVLPFDNLGPTEEGYFSDGVSDEITARLTGIDALGIIARTSAIQYKDTDKTPQQIGSELGVAYILDGTVRWQHAENGNSRVRITPQLVDVSDETLVWSVSYEQDIDNIFAVQSDIAERVAEALDVTLLEPERQTLKRHSTNKIEAYEFYLRGNDAMNRWTEASLHTALDAFAKAVDVDPNFALAYARMAETHLWLYAHYYDRTDARLDEARAAIEHAAALDPDLAEVSVARGKYHQLRGDYEGALEQYERARRQQPGNKDLMTAIATIQRRQGNLDQAVYFLDRAARLDPRDYNTQYELALTQLFHHQYPAAERAFDRTHALVPDWWVPYLFKSILFMSWRGSLAEAQAVMQEAAAHIGRDTLVFELLNAGAWATFRFMDEDFQRVLEDFSLASAEVDSASTYLAKAELYGRRANPALATAFYDSARVVLERLVQAVPDDPYYRSWLGIAYAGSGHPEDALREGRQATTLLPAEEDVWDGTDFLWYLAEIYVLVGDYDAAIEQLRRALTYPGLMSRAWLEVEDFWNPLRSNDAFQALLAEQP